MDEMKFGRIPDPPEANCEPPEEWEMATPEERKEMEKRWALQAMEQQYYKSLRFGGM